MNVLAEIIAARTCGVTYAQFVVRERHELVDVLPWFDLVADTSALEMVERSRAERIAIALLTHDLAYDTQIMPDADAVQLVAAFLGLFGDARLECWTNANFNEEGSRLRLSGWGPLTDSTFDAGILVLSHAHAGCIWVQDED